MSLLMDALKKAEQEKKEAAKRKENEIVQDKGKSDESDTAAIDSSAAKSSGDNEKNPDGLTLETINENSAVPGDNEIADEETDKEIKPTRVGVEESKDNRETPEISEIERLDLDEQVTDNESGKETDMDVMYENREDTTPDHFYSDSDTITTRPFVSAEQLIRDIGGGRDQPTPVSASTVFSAKGYVPDNQGVKWTVFVILCLIITVSFSVLYYYSVSHSVLELRSPIVTMDAGLRDKTKVSSQLTGPTDVPVESRLIETTTTGPETLVEVRQETEEPELTVENGANEQVAGTTDQPVIAPQMVAESVNHDDMATDESQAVVTEPDINQEIMEIDEERQTILDETAQDPADSIDKEIEKIQISKSKSLDTHASILSKAYQAYLSGNYDQAESGYKKVLEKYPENRDALLGIAAIRYRQGDIQSAYLNYLQVLTYYPGDITAQSGLIGLNKNIDPIKGESAIKSLLQKQPNTPYLYFTLGNLYAGQEKWMKAQQAFFDAFRTDSSNPDYALNLAVSLDRIGQQKTALDYYHVALDLASRYPVSFDTASVSSRISKLKNKLYVE